eukprot:264892-Rhodomonas_salina.1
MKLKGFYVKVFHCTPKCFAARPETLRCTAKSFAVPRNQMHGTFIRTLSRLQVRISAYLLSVQHTYANATSNLWSRV